MAKGQQQLQDEGDKARKNGVDAKNRADAKRAATIAAKLAKTPLTDAEQVFVGLIASKMNNGRHVDKPSAANILKYSKLVGRKDIKPEEE